MSRVYRLIMFGRELFAWEIDGALEVHVTTDDDDDECDISSGTSHNFERDLNPPDPMREEPWYEDRKSFGFGDG